MEMMRDPYLYPNTEVLKNKLGVMDNEKLNTIEAEYTSTRLKEIIDNPIKGNFSFDHLCRMHYYKLMSPNMNLSQRKNSPILKK